LNQRDQHEKQNETELISAFDQRTLDRLLLPGRIIPWRIPAQNIRFWWTRDHSKPIIIPKKYLGEDPPSKTWDNENLHEWGDRIVKTLAYKAHHGDVGACHNLALLAKSATSFLNSICGNKPELIRPLSRNVRPKKRTVLGAHPRNLKIRKAPANQANSGGLCQEFWNHIGVGKIARQNRVFECAVVLVTPRARVADIGADRH
jgi:hypothetical protein